MFYFGRGYPVVLLSVPEYMMIVRCVALSGYNLKRFLQFLSVYWVRCSYGFDNNSVIFLKVKFVSAQLEFINQLRENVFALGFLNAAT